MGKRFYFPNLDASRFLAFVPVFLTHAFFTNNEQVQNSPAYAFVTKHLQLGLLGLDYFFVLSGFLITWIILEEFNLTSHFSLKNFYIRRSLRIFPLYFLVVLVGFLLVYSGNFFAPHTFSPLPDFLYFLSFTLNFYVIEHGREFLFFLVFFWSVAVEEQFYLAWALLLSVFRKNLLLSALAAIFLSICFRMYYINDDNRLVFHTVSSLADFGLGALLAWTHMYFPSWKKIFSASGIKPIKAMLWIAFAACLWNYSTWFSRGSMLVLERLIFGLFFTAFIAIQIGDNRATFLPGRIQIFETWGKRSFGLYCYHGIAITMYKMFIDLYVPEQNMFMCFLLNPCIVLLLTLAFTGLSFRYFEEPVFRLRKKFYALPEN